MWRKVKLGDVCDLQNGFAFKSSDYVDKSNTLNIRMSNIRPNGKFDEFHKIKYLPDDYANKYADYKLIEGDLILAMTDMAGDPKILGMPTIIKNLDGRTFLLNQRVGKLHSFSDEICVPYLCYFLSTLKNFFKSKGAGGLQINISKKDILSAEIPLPPLLEQERIVAKLDKAFAEIDRAVEGEIYHIDTAQQLRESILISRFSELDDESEQLLLSDACTDFSRGKSKHRPRNDERLYGDVIPFVQTGDISNAKKHLSTYTKMYSEFGIEQSKQWSKGTVCITIAANIAELAILDMKACFPDSVIGALPDENITSSEYIFYLLNYFQKKIKAKSKGFAQQNINLATFSDETFPFPTLERQKQISTELAELDAHIDSIIEIRNEKINSFHALKKSILAQEFQPSQGEAA